MLQRPDEKITEAKKSDSQGSICSRYRFMINFRLSCATNDETGSDILRLEQSEGRQSLSLNVQVPQQNLLHIVVHRVSIVGKQ